MNKNQIKQQSKEEKRKDAMKVFKAINEERLEEDYNNNPNVIRRESNKMKLKKKRRHNIFKRRIFLF